jgi:hypothetical protein
MYMGACFLKPEELRIIVRQKGFRVNAVALKRQFGHAPQQIRASIFEF